MVNQSLINPASIVIAGASNNLSKPGGKLLRNILEGGYSRPVYVLHPTEKTIQGIQAFQSAEELPEVDLAILAVSPKDCLEISKILLTSKKTKAIIIISAGFSELDDEGKKIEQQITQLVNENQACLIGPNCIGVLNQNYHGVFTTPIPKLTDDGCDLISSSGATAVFLMEEAIPRGLKFSNVFSIGNAAQTSIADILEYLDENFSASSSRVKLLYFENIVNPQKLLKHATALIHKGCKIAAIKAGTTPSGSRAAASHTGAIANPDLAVKALFRRAGIVLCQSRQELIATASVFNYKVLRGKNIAIITHAGGSAVMLTDSLSRGGLNVPELSGKNANELCTYLNKGSSVKNPIDFLATGTAEQLGIIIDFCEHKFDEIDAMVVVFGSPGLFDVENVYRVLSVKLDVCQKPIYPVLPSVMNAQKEIAYFLSKGHVSFSDEVVLGDALSAVYQTQKPIDLRTNNYLIDAQALRKFVYEVDDGFLNPDQVHKLLSLAGIQHPLQKIIRKVSDLEKLEGEFNFPVAMKVVGPLHKSEINGVVLNVNDLKSVRKQYDELMNFDGVDGVLIQEMCQGTELFIGAKFEDRFGHVLLFGLGGIFVEILQDFQFCMVPTDQHEVSNLLKKLKGYPLFEGARGKKPIDESAFIEVILKISTLLTFVPEIEELDLNPLLADGNKITAVDARIRLNKNKVYEKFY
jgi:acyl-CoA synthetase (NDP forming)